MIDARGHQPAGTPGLRWRIVTVLLAVSLLPLILVGAGSGVVFGGLLMEESMRLRRGLVRTRAATIDRYLQERLRALQLIARTHRLEGLSTEPDLRRLFDELSASHPGAFVDLGVIDAAGRHLAYVGPYDLRDKDYGGAEWFQSVLAAGHYISDVFLGYREAPHCIIAVHRQEGERAWILRATINSESLHSVVRGGELGTTGDAFLLNAEGRYQTPPRLGHMLEASPVGPARPHRGVRELRVESGGVPIVRHTTWLEGQRWMLVVQQSESEIMAPVRQAVAVGAVVVLLAVGLVVVTTFLATGHLTHRIERATAERDQLQEGFLRSAKLASLGELATGLAHEINNPLAVITAEHTNIEDQVEDLELPPRQARGILESTERCRRQVERCASITSKMLQFGRNTAPSLRPTALPPLLEEVAGLMMRQATVRGVDLKLDVEPDLPLVVLDGNELQQVLVNLVNNALAALAGGGCICISARREDSDIVIRVEDDGEGIQPEHLDRIFQPFFTTKPVGQGTGLGLAVCYGIVRGWGGTMGVESKPGAGALFSVRLPTPQPEAPRRSARAEEPAEHQPSPAHASVRR